MTGLSTSNTTNLRISMMNCSDFQDILIMHVISVHISCMDFSVQFITETMMHLDCVCCAASD